MKRRMTAAAVSGLVIAGLREWLYAAALDEKNLLMPFHPLEMLIWAITAVMAVVLLLWVRKRGYAYGEVPTGLAAALGCFALALALVPEVLALRGDFLSLMEKLCLYGGILAVPSVACVGICRLRGKTPFFGFHALLCAWICLRLVVIYRVWSGDPQLMDYVLPMMANVCMGLFAYQQAAWDVNSASPRSLLCWGLLAVFFCMGSLGSEEPLFYAAGAFWALTNLSRHSPASGYPRRAGKEF